MKSVIVQIEKQYLRHQLWALQWALKIPLLSIFFLFTLNLWWIIPAIPLSFLTLYLLYASQLFLASLVFVLGLLLLLSPYFSFFEWYCLSIGLMIGTGASAQAKHGDIERRYAELVGGKSDSSTFAPGFLEICLACVLAGAVFYIIVAII